MEDGHWITPFVYGERFAERPVLLSWIAALFGEMTGGVTLWSLRIPHLVFFLAGAILIYSLLRSNAGSKIASIFGALCWLNMPVVAPKFINAEADVVLSTLLFVAFYMWWRAMISKRLTLLTWLGIGVLIGLAGLTKGPQPVAYFTLGVGAYLLMKDRDQIPAFLAANVLAALMIGGWYAMVNQPNDIDQWIIHSRLLTTTGLELVRDHLDFVTSMAVETLPAAILIGPAIAIVLRTWRSGEHDLMLAATLYSVICTLFLVFWPGGVAARYAMPATMTLAVICGIMFDYWRHSHPRVIASALVVSYLIFAGLLVRGWVAMPFWPHLFKESQIAGNAISSVLQRSPGPLYVVGTSTEHNMLGYVRGKIHAVTIDDMARLKTSAVAILLPEEELDLIRKNPEMRLIDYANVVSQRRAYRVVVLQPAEIR
jgi:4-amino-4-deoxy-L-arabinose transferase-like glycosyltransferase